MSPKRSIRHKKSKQRKQDTKQWIGFFVLLVMIISLILAIMLIGK